MSIEPLSSDPRLVIVVVSGGADPSGSVTPLQEAGTPALDRIARDGHLGRVALRASSHWAGFTRLLGQPADGLSLGCAEARARGVAGMGGSPQDSARWAARADFVTVDDTRILDPLGGGIGDTEADVLLRALSDRLEGARLVRLDGVRNLWLSALPIDPTPAPWCAGTRAPRAVLASTAGALALFDASYAVLAPHDVNAVRLDLGENPANALWPHGAGPLDAPVTLPEWASGRRVAVVAAGGGAAGLADALGWDAVRVDGDDEALSAAALAALPTHDIVVVRSTGVLRAGVAAADTDAARDARRDAFSALDARLVGPLLGALEERGPFLLAVAADGGTDVAGRAMSAEPVPFGLLHSGAVGAHGAVAFHEGACRDAGHDLRTPEAFGALVAREFANASGLSA